MDKKSKEENVTEETQLNIEEQTEYRTRLSVAFQLLLPVAGLIFVLFRQKSILNRLLVQLDRNCVSVLCPSLSRRERLLKWASNRLPPTWSSNSKTLSGGIAELWSDGSLLCTLLNSAVPGACPNPHRHWKKPPTHAQSIAYKYLGVIPLFTEDDLSESLNPNLERPFLHYLNELYKAIHKLTENNNGVQTLCVAYIPRGMGLFSGEQYKKTVFYIYVDEQFSNDNDSTILVHIRGPYGIYGEAVVPTFPQNVSNSPKTKTNSDLNSPKPPKQNSGFIKKLTLPFLKYHKQYIGDNMIIDVIMEETRAKITYIPRNYGMYEINMIANGELLKGCPFNVHIIKNTTGIKDSFQHEENVFENATYTIRKVTPQKNEAFDDSEVEDRSQNLEYQKNKFNFETVVEEITKNGDIFKNLEKTKENGDEYIETNEEEFIGISNLISTIEEVEEHIESEIDSSLGFSETISEESNNELDETKTDLEKNKKFHYNLNANQSDLSYASNQEINEITSSNPVPINISNGNDVTNINFIITDNKNKQNARQVYDTQSTSLINENVVRSNYLDNDSADAPLKVKEHQTVNINVSKVNIPEIFNASVADRKFIKNVINSSNKYETSFKKYFQLNNWTEDRNNNQIVTGIGTKLKKNKTLNSTYKDINENKRLENSVRDYVQMEQEISNKPSHNNVPKTNKTTYKSITTTNNKVYRAVIEFIPASNETATKIEKSIPITQKQFLQEMLDISEYKMNQYEEVDKHKTENRNLTYTEHPLLLTNLPKSENKSLSKTKLGHLNKFTEISLDTKKIDEDKVIHNDDFVNKEVVKAKTEHKHLHPNSPTILEVENSKPKPSNSTTTSPICTDHIVSEVPYNEMSLAEKRQIFSANLSTNIPNSTNSSFSETEDAEVFKNQRHLKFEGLSVLNVLGSLKQSQSCANTEYSLTTTVSLPNISALDSEYVFPQLVKEKKCFWEEVTSTRTNFFNKIESSTKSNIKNMAVKRVSSFPVSEKYDNKNDSFETKSREKTLTAINSLSIVYSQTNSLNQSLPNLSQQSDGPILHNLVKEKKNFWETLPPKMSIPVIEKQSRLKPKNENMEKIAVEETAKNSLSSSDETSSSMCSYDFDSPLNQSLPNISLRSDNQSVVKQKKNFWELITSRSSSSLSSKSSPKKFDENERLRLIWKKPQQEFSQKKSRTEPFEIYKSADDILSMTEYYANQSSKKYKSLDNSLDNCAAVSIEERKKMLLKQNYDKERLARERLLSSKTQLFLKSNAEFKSENVKKKAYFSPVIEKIRKFNSVSSLEEKNTNTKPDTKIEMEKPESSKTDLNEKFGQVEKPIIKSHFKRAVKYFKNLEAKSLSKAKSKLENSTNSNQEIQQKFEKTRKRGGSLNLPNVSNRFLVKNLYKDVFGSNRGSFKGIPNRSALVEALATFSRKDANKIYPVEEDEDDIKFDIFKKNIKTKKRKSLRSVFDLY